MNDNLTMCHTVAGFTACKLHLNKNRGRTLGSDSFLWVPMSLTHSCSRGQRLRLTESDKLRVQIQAYLDNVFDVSTLLEDTETKNAVLEHMEELQEQTTLVRRNMGPGSALTVNLESLGLS